MRTVIHLPAGIRRIMLHVLNKEYYNLPQQNCDLYNYANENLSLIFTVILLQKSFQVGYATF